MQSPSRKKYLLLDKRCRRYSAPDDLRLGFAKAYASEESEDDSRQSKISVIDLSILFEDQSGSDSSLELDTSVSQPPTPRASTADISQGLPVLPVGCYDCRSSSVKPNTTWPAFNSWQTWKLMLILQVMSLCVSVINLTTDNMAQPLSVNAQNLAQYLYVGLVWTPQLALREGGRGIMQVIRLSGLRYIFLALFHVEASNLASLALRHETYIGNQMMDCVAASLAIVMAYVCLQVEFQVTHLLGFTVAFTGALGMCAANTYPPDDGLEDAVWGDIVRLVCGIFLCFNTLAEELIVKSIDTVEYLGMIGLLGSAICGVQTMAMDSETILPTDGMYWCYFITLSVAQFTIICLAPMVLRDVGTTGMHLSLITYTFYYNLTLYIAHITFEMSQLMMISFVLIIGGSYIFALKRTSIGMHYFYPMRVTVIPNENNN